MKKVFLLLSISLAIFFQACSTQVEEVKPRIVFPSYPEDPKIIYLDTYRGGSTTKKSTLSGAFDAFLGEEKSVSGSSNIVKPYGVGLQNGKVYVADTGSNVVFKMDEKSREVEFIGDGVVGRLSSPVSIAFDSNETVYVSDTRQKKIQGYDKDGKLIFVLGGRLEFSNPTGIAINKELNRLYVVDTKQHSFKAFDIATQELLFAVGKRGNLDSEFNYPTNIAIDSRNGNIAVVDTQNFRIQIFDKDGNFIRKFGKIGDRPGMFARPKGVGIDSEGHIYVSDAAFNNVQIFNDLGQLLLYFGGAGYAESQFRLIAGIYIDENDKIVIADGFSGRVQTFQYISEKYKEKYPEKYKELKEFKPEI